MLLRNLCKTFALNKESFEKSLKIVNVHITHCKSI